MQSKVCIPTTRLTKLKTKKKLKDKTKIENVGGPSAYSFTRRAGHVIKVVLCNPFPLQQA